MVAASKVDVKNVVAETVGKGLVVLGSTPMSSRVQNTPQLLLTTADAREKNDDLRNRS